MKQKKIELVARPGWVYYTRRLTKKAGTAAAAAEASKMSIIGATNWFTNWRTAFFVIDTPKPPQVCGFFAQLGGE